MLISGMIADKCVKSLEKQKSERKRDCQIFFPTEGIEGPRWFLNKQRMKEKLKHLANFMI